jgi:DNA-binding transcriptional regulator YhcF (GntR family)
MDVFIQKIKNLSEISTLSKHEQIVNGITECIDEKILVKGDKLPSINQMVSQIGFARKTIVKAYEELKDRGIVESKKLKGYFILNTETKVVLKVALLLYSLRRFQEEYYNALRKQLGKTYQIDVYFHHNNLEIFQTIISNIEGKYGMYIVAPIQKPEVVKILKKFEPKKLLVVDRYVELGNNFSYIYQEFESTTYDNLVAQKKVIKTYKKIVLFFRTDSDYPVGVLNGFKKFLKDFDVQGEVIKKYKKDSVEKGVLYFFVGDNGLWEIIKDCAEKDVEVGREVGILSHNDHIIKELVCGGITTISTDFNEMAIETAKYVNNGNQIKKIIPSKLILRKSL